MAQFFLQYSSIIFLADYFSKTDVKDDSFYLTFFGEDTNNLAPSLECSLVMITTYNDIHSLNCNFCNVNIFTLQTSCDLCCNLERDVFIAEL